MSATSLIQELGFAPDQRVVVVHVDDLGMCAAANAGGLQAQDALATCGSVMVPCPGFEALAEQVRGRPALDLGVHLTLNAEYDSVRWAPLCSDVPSLVSPDGGMWRSVAETVQHASPAEVDRELRAQIDRALAAGLDVTHLDSHMGTVFQPPFVDVYAGLARDYRLPLFAPRITQELLRLPNLPPGVERYAGVVESLAAEGFPLFDHFDNDSLHFEPGRGLEHNRRRLERMPPGLSYLILHCARGDAELAEITPDTWRQRSEEQRIYTDGSMAAVLEELGIATLGMRPLRDLLRERCRP